MMEMIELTVKDAVLQALEQARSEISNVGTDLQDYNDSLRALAKKYKMTVKEPEH